MLLSVCSPPSCCLCYSAVGCIGWQGVEEWHGAALQIEFVLCVHFCVHLHPWHAPLHADNYVISTWCAIDCSHGVGCNSRAYVCRVWAPLPSGNNLTWSRGNITMASSPCGASRSTPCNVRHYVLHHTRCSANQVVNIRKYALVFNSQCDHSWHMLTNTHVQCACEHSCPCSGVCSYAVCIVAYSSPWTLVSWQQANARCAYSAWCEFPHVVCETVHETMPCIICCQQRVKENMGACCHVVAHMWQAHDSETHMNTTEVVSMRVMC